MKSENLISPFQCRIFQLQCVGESGTPFNICLNNHRKRRENFCVLKLKTLYPDVLIKNYTTLINIEFLVLLLHSTSMSTYTFLADWNDCKEI